MPPKKASSGQPNEGRDKRYQSFPIPLKFTQKSNEHSDTELQDALLPYFAMQFTPISTRSNNNNCGLYALSISYNAARNALRAPGTPEYAPILIKQWRLWLKGDDYQTACLKFVTSQPGFFGQTEEEEMNYVKTLQSHENLDNTELSCLLDVANHYNNTNFQLGVVFEGWRGRINPKDKEKFDNDYIQYSYARTSNLEMKNGPMLWIFNNSRQAKQTDWTGIGVRRFLNHWEGLEYNPNMNPGEPRVKMIYNYRIGAILEADIRKGVWFLTEDSPGHQKHPGHLEAYKGSFLRDAPPASGLPVPRGFRYMKNCIGDSGLVDVKYIIRVIAKDKMPTAKTDPTNADLHLPKDSPPKLDGEGKAGHTPAGKKGDSKGMNGEDERPTKVVDYEYRPLKICRVIPATTKAGEPISKHEEVFLGGFKFENGDFVMDSGQRGGDGRTAFVKNINGRKGEVPLRRLQLLKRPWNLSDELPFSALEDIDESQEYEHNLELAKLRGIQDFSSKASLIKGLKADLDERREKTETGISLFRLTKDYTAAEARSTTSFQNGEIVAWIGGSPEAKNCKISNFEGYQGVIPLGLQNISTNCWGIWLNRQEFELLGRSQPRNAITRAASTATAITAAKNSQKQGPTAGKHDLRNANSDEEIRPTKKPRKK